MSGTVLQSLLFPSKTLEYLINPSVLMTRAKTINLQSERFSFERPNCAHALFSFFKIGIGQVIQNNLVLDVKQLIGATRQMPLQFILHAPERQRAFIKPVFRDLFPWETGDFTNARVGLNAWRRF